MTQADSVHSTPPTNTSVIHENPTRRGFLAQAAFAAAGGAALGVALPSPGLAGASERAPDPIYALIERHRELSARYDAAVSVSANLFEGPEFDAAEEVTAAACDDLFDFADTLVSSEPTTLAGVIALLRYAAEMHEWELPRDRKVSNKSGEPTGWTRTFFATVAKALDQIGAQA